MRAMSVPCAVLNHGRFTLFYISLRSTSSVTRSRRLYSQRSEFRIELQLDRIGRMDRTVSHGGSAMEMATDGKQPVGPTSAMHIPSRRAGLACFALAILLAGCQRESTVARLEALPATGQGLPIARSVVVNKHGGALRFETECGKGTTFFIRLPTSTLDRPQTQVAA
jgi:hypothetical protein